MLAVSALVVCLPVAAQTGNVDIQPQKNVRFNGAQFQWGAQAQLGKVAPGAGNRCRVTLEYMTVNQGQATRAAYLNRYLVDGAQVGSRAVAAGSRGGERFTETLDLPAGQHQFQLVLDAGNAIAERDEANNRQTITYTVACGVTGPKIDVTAAPTLRVAALNVQWNNPRPLTLRSSQANARRDGYCRFPIAFTIVEADRRAVTTPFSVVIVENQRDGMPAQTIPSIPAGGQAPVTGQVWLRCCKRTEPRFAVLHIDPPQSIRLDERNRENNRFTLNYEITGSCN
ncbi:MAG TPA: CARDB domain-containing protein [Thermoanaerobaculia bacterium]